MKNIQKRYFSKENLKLINVASENIKALELGDQQENSKDLSKNILLFHESEKNTNTSDIVPHSILDQSSVAYLQGHTVNSGSSANYTEETKNPLLEKVAFYNKELHDNPQNIALWLDFVSFQENFLENSGTPGHKDNLLNQSARNILEKKVLILEKAIEANPASIDLKVARLKLCQDLWEPKHVLESWERLVSANSANSSLWKNYLLYMQASLSLFSVSKVTKLYHKCFKCLLEIRNTTSSQTQANNLDKDLLGK